MEIALRAATAWRPEPSVRGWKPTPAEVRHACSVGANTAIFYFQGATIAILSFLRGHYRDFFSRPEGGNIVIFPRVHYRDFFPWPEGATIADFFPWSL